MEPKPPLAYTLGTKHNRLPFFLCLLCHCCRRPQVQCLPAPTTSNSPLSTSPPPLTKHALSPHHDGSLWVLLVLISPATISNNDPFLAA